MATTKTDSVKSSRPQPMAWYLTMYQALTATSAIISKSMAVVKSTITTLMTVSTRWAKLSLSMATHVGNMLSKSMQGITAYQKVLWSWVTSTASSKSVPKDTEGQLAFLVDASVKKGKWHTLKIDSPQASGVAVGFTDLLKVTTGKSGKPTKSGKSSSTLTQTYEALKRQFNERTVEPSSADLAKLLHRKTPKGVVHKCRVCNKNKTKPKNRTKKSKYFKARTSRTSIRKDLPNSGGYEDLSY